jgi:hypothetical protein
MALTGKEIGKDTVKPSNTIETVAKDNDSPGSFRHKEIIK